MMVLCLKKLTLAVKPSMREVRYWLRIVVFSRSNRSSPSFLFSMNSLTFLYTRLSTATEFWYLRCECTVRDRKFGRYKSCTYCDTPIYFWYLWFTCSRLSTVHILSLNYYHHKWFWMVLNAKLTDLLESCCTNPKIFLTHLFFKQLPIFLYR